MISVISASNCFVFFLSYSFFFFFLNTFLQLEKSKERKKRKRDAERTGEARQEPRTIESMREPDDTIVNADDEEVRED